MYRKICGYCGEYTDQCGCVDHSKPGNLCNQCDLNIIISAIRKEATNLLDAFKCFKFDLALATTHHCKAAHRIEDRITEIIQLTCMHTR